MKKEKLISGLLAIVGIMMISIAVFIQNVPLLNGEEIDVVNMAASSNMYVKDTNKSNEENISFKEVEMEVTPTSVDLRGKTIVYDGLTLEELGAKIDRNLKGYISGKGYLLASYCMEKGVDPYIATAIMLHETGCRANCSKLVQQCNNVGGQKGWPTCGSGSFKRFDTLDDGIRGFVNNLYKNYYAYGLTTVEQIAPKYAEGNTWAGKINWYVNVVKNS